MTTAAKIAELVQGTVIGDGERAVNGVASLKDAKADQISFYGNKKYANMFAESQAGTVIVSTPRGMLRAESISPITISHLIPKERRVSYPPSAAMTRSPASGQREP